MTLPDKLNVRAGRFQGSATGPSGIRTLFVMFCLRVVAMPLGLYLLWIVARHYL
jgi:hypothetical protein